MTQYKPIQTALSFSGGDPDDLDVPVEAVIRMRAWPLGDTIQFQVKGDTPSSEWRSVNYTASDPEYVEATIEDRTSGIPKIGQRVNVEVMITLQSNNGSVGNGRAIEVIQQVYNQDAPLRDGQGGWSLKVPTKGEQINEVAALVWPERIVDGYWKQRYATFQINRSAEDGGIRVPIAFFIRIKKFDGSREYWIESSDPVVVIRRIST